VALVLAMTACPSDDEGGRDPEPEGCGDDVCSKDENQTTCPADCKPMNGPVCGDNECEGNESSTCPADCNTAKCGNKVCEVGETSTCPTDCPASLKTMNSSSYVVYSLYVAKCGDQTWGVDQTGSGYINVGASFTLNGIPPGCYFFRAENSATRYWQTQEQVTLQPSSQFTWTLGN
jgi:hypothetical protein